MTTVALTLGDPRGIGPEIAAEVYRDPPPGVDLVVLGPDAMVREFDGEGVGAGDRNVDDAVAGELTYGAVRRAVELVRDGSVNAICTGPASKQALNAAGHLYPGHTELLAELAGVDRAVMMLVSAGLRVALITTHVPFARVLETLNHDLIVDTARVVEKSLRELWKIDAPRVALYAINPHAGEGGLFGTEESELLEPAARTAGVAGPFSADTVFVRALRGEFDAVLAPYHDVGMTAIKVAAFGGAVNVTLGLPFVRTSPDHGTAFDIAGQGIADASSLRAAVELAAQLSA